MLHKSQKRQTPALNRRKEKVRKDLVKDALIFLGNFPDVDQARINKDT
jgi:hypothetical protein